MRAVLNPDTPTVSGRPSRVASRRRPSRALGRSAAPLGLAAALALAACGGSDEGADDASTDATGQATATFEAPATGEAGEAAAEPSPETTPEAAAEPAVDGGTVFTDPQGTYELTVDPEWPSDHGTITADTEVWFVGEATAEFAPNVNVITQAAGGQDLESYLQLSIDQAPVLIQDFALVDEQIVQGAAGQQLGLMEYTGDGLHFLAVFGLGGDQAVIATLTAPTEQMAELRETVLPYLETLQPTPAA